MKFEMVEKASRAQAGQRANPSTRRQRAKTRAGTWQKKFIVVLGQCGNVKDACLAARIDRRAAYRWRKKDAAFARAWDDAREEAIDELEREAWRRAYDGVERPVFWQGAKVGAVREYSDSLLTFLLRSNRRKYADRHEFSGPGGEPLAGGGVVIVLPANGREVREESETLHGTLQEEGLK